MRLRQLFTICLMTSSFMTVNLARSPDSRVQSRIFQLQEQICGRQFCEKDPLTEPPLCVEESPVDNMDTNTTEPELQAQPPRRQFQPPCATCSCSDNCRVFGDCCADKYIGAQFYFDCEEIKLHGERSIDTYHSYVVKHCPSDAHGYTPRLAEQCEHGELGYIQDGRYVSAPGDFNTSVTFRNKYCALCYNITDYSPWDVIVSCETELEMSDVMDVNGLIRLANESSLCTISFSSSDIRRSPVCERYGDVINFCNVTGRWHRYSAEIEQACHAYINPIKIYRNIFCALCNGETVEGLICSSGDYVLPKHPPIIMPFSAILNFDRSDVEVIKGDYSGYPILRIGQQVESDCRPEDVYDNIYKKCREKYCPITVALRENCVELLKSEHFVLTTLKVTGYFIDDFIIHFGLGLFTEVGAVLAMNYADILSECGTSVIEFSNRDFLGIHSTRELIYKQINFELVLFLQENSSLEYSWQCLASKDNLTMNVTLWKKTIVINFVQEIDFKNVTKLLATPLVHRELEFPSSESLDETKVTRVPFGFNLSCSLIRFHTKEINSINGNIIIHNKTELESNEFFVRDGEQYFVCLDDVQLQESEPSIKRVSRSDSLNAETILTGVCLSCSLLCLLLTLLVYILLKELHTVPGLNLILLTSSLFVAQALYLFGAGTVTTPTICTVLAVLIHYFWLVSFAWMNVCCIHMFRVFNNLFDSLNFADNKCCLVFKYAVFSYGVPACIVGATILTSFFESGYIGYGGNQLCFVAPGLTSIYSFGIPVGLTVLSNTGLLIYTVVQVRRAKSGYLDRTGASEVSKFFTLSTITRVSLVFGFVKLRPQVHSKRAGTRNHRI